MSAILQKIILTGCTGLFMVPAAVGQSAVEANRQTAFEPILNAVNRVDRVGFQAQPVAAGAFMQKATGLEPAIIMPSPLSDPMDEWPAKPEEHPKVAVLSSSQTRPGPTPTQTGRSRHERSRLVAG